MPRVAKENVDKSKKTKNSPDEGAKKQKTKRTARLLKNGTRPATRFLVSKFFRPQ
jgi:hypothetical protein